jgi:DNA-binding GntR family transcriptional regulator
VPYSFDTVNRFATVMPRVRVYRHCRHSYAGDVAAKKLQSTAGAIRADIASGSLEPGSKVGASLGVLARRYHAGIGTVRAALNMLADEGLVETIPGKGTFVLDAPREAPPVDQSAAIEQRVTAAEMDISELYAKLGYKQPSHQRNGRRARHEQAG